ncbi:MAG: hypothetical protein JEY79_17385 [Pseudodesulfovibrio sp.]|nr:hypothetical protein [Pseudodesulfovibrio sp.]
MPNFILIPIYLIEQVEPKVDMASFMASAHGIAANPDTVICVFSPMDPKAEDRAVVKGFFWATVNRTSGSLDVHMLSIDEEYQGRGIVEETNNILAKIAKSNGLSRSRFLTVMPEVFESIGATRSKSVMMEVNYG